MGHHRPFERSYVKYLLRIIEHGIPIVEYYIIVVERRSFLNEISQDIPIALLTGYSGPGSLSFSHLFSPSRSPSSALPLVLGTITTGRVHTIALRRGTSNVSGTAAVPSLLLRSSKRAYTGLLLFLRLPPPLCPCFASPPPVHCSWSSYNYTVGADDRDLLGEGMRQADNITHVVFW